MIPKFKPLALMAVAALAMAVPAARADVTLTMQSTINSPMLDKAREHMTPQQEDAIDSMLRNTMYMSGKRYRMDMAMMSFIVDAGAKQMTLLNPNQRTYAVTPINPDAMKMMMGSAGLPQGQGTTPTYTVKDTGKSTKYLGHTCRHYIMDMTMTMPQIGTMKTHSDVLAATDLPGLDTGVYEALAMQTGVKGQQMHGVPLLTKSVITGGMIGTMDMEQKAQDINTDPIPADKFEVPAGYTEKTSAEFFKGLTPAGRPATPPVQ